MTLDELVKQEAKAEKPKAQKSSGSAVLDVAASLTPPGMAEAVGNFAKPSILPTAGSIALPAALTALAGPANAPFIPLEQGVGSGMGEAANQMFGITEPSLTNIGVSAALPTALGYGANALRALKTVVPPSAGAETLNALAPKEAAAKVAGYRGGTPSVNLFEQASKEGAIIPTQKTQDLIKAVLDNPNIAGAEKKAMQKVLKETGYTEFTSGQAAGLNPARMQRVLNATGELTPSAQGYEGGNLKRIFGALSDDLEAAASQPGASTLKLARDTYKREKVLDTIDKSIAGAFKINRGQGEAGQFNANKIINTLQDETDTLGKFFKQAFSGTERKDLVDFFKFLNTIPTLKPGAGQQYGSGRAIRDVLAPATAAGGAGFAGSGGDPMVTGLATAAGALAPQAAESVTMLRQVWSLPGGRQMLKGLLANSDGALTPQVMGALGAFLSGQSSGANVSPAGTVRPFPMEQ